MGVFGVIGTVPSSNTVHVDEMINNELYDQPDYSTTVLQNIYAQ